MLAQGIAPELIERGGEATGMPVPPLLLSDAVALDLIHQINIQTRNDIGEAYRQSAGYDLVGRLVEQMGRTGKKVGKGFYDYCDNGEKQLWPGLAQATGGKFMVSSAEDVRDRLLAAQALETARALEQGVITDPSEADVGALLGWGFAPWTGGPLAYIDTQGTAQFVARCDALADRARCGRSPRVGGGSTARTGSYRNSAGKAFDSGK
jgi:3-hydroxyacyl-CoA dehydrogenase/enoyl-CoA hydratase/3-hydroxybutyryl-CoA epimerase